MSKDENNRIGNLIRQIRLSKGMSQMLLAEKLDITYQQVQKYEYGKSELTVSRLRQIADVLDVPVNIFIEQRMGVADHRDVFLTDEEIKLLKNIRDIKNKRLKKGIVRMLGRFLDITNSGEL